MLQIFNNYQDSKIDLFTFFKENISRITQGGSEILEHGNLSIRSYIPYYPPQSEQPNINFIDNERIVNLPNIRIWDAF